MSDTAVVAAPAGERSVWPAVGLFLGGQAVSLACDQVFFIAVVWAAARLGGGAGVTAVTLAESVPRMLAMLFGGAVCDALGPRAVLLRATSVRVGVLGVAAVVALWAPGLWLLVLVTLCEGALLGLGSPAFGTLLPRMVADRQLARANSGLAMAARFAPIVGSPLGAWLIASGRIAPALAVVCAGCAVSLACLTRVTRGLSTPRAAPPGTGLARRSVDGFRLLRADRRLRRMFVSALCLDFAFAWPMNPGLPLVVAGRGWGVTAVAWVIAGFGAGALASAGLGAVLGDRIPVAVRLVGGAAGVAGCLLLMIAMPGLAATVAAAVALGVCSGQNGPAMVTLYQRAAPRESLGVAMSMLTLSGIGAAPLAYVVFGVLAGLTGPSTAWTACGLLALGAPLAAARALRTPEPTSPDPTTSLTPRLP